MLWQCVVSREIDFSLEGKPAAFWARRLKNSRKVGFKGSQLLLIVSLQVLETRCEIAASLQKILGLFCFLIAFTASQLKFSFLFSPLTYQEISSCDW